MAVSDSQGSLDPRLRPKKALPNVQRVGSSPLHESNTTPPALASLRTANAWNLAASLPDKTPTGPRSLNSHLESLNQVASRVAPAPSAISSASNPSDPPPQPALQGPASFTEWSQQDYIVLYHALASCIPLELHAPEVVDAFNSRSAITRCREDILARALEIQQRPIEPALKGKSDAVHAGNSSVIKDAGTTNAAQLAGVSVAAAAMTTINAAKSIGLSKQDLDPTGSSNSANSSQNAGPHGSEHKRDEPQPAEHATSASSKSRSPRQHGGRDGPALIVESDRKRLRVEIAPRASKFLYLSTDGSVRVELP